MKPQDIAFFVVIVVLVYLRKPKLFVLAGIFCLIVSIPLFAKWVFFTAERLTWYGVGFFFVSVMLNLFGSRVQRK